MNSTNLIVGNKINAVSKKSYFVIYDLIKLSTNFQTWTKKIVFFFCLVREGNEYTEVNPKTIRIT